MAWCDAISSDSFQSRSCIRDARRGLALAAFVLDGSRLESMTNPSGPGPSQFDEAKGAPVCSCKSQQNLPPSAVCFLPRSRSDRAQDKLSALRRLDQSRAWNSLDDQLYCTICKSLISGRQIEVVGGTNGLRALHLKCSTPGCFSTPADWLLPVKSDTVREIDILFRDNGA